MLNDLISSGYISCTALARIPSRSPSSIAAPGPTERTWWLSRFASLGRCGPAQASSWSHNCCTSHQAASRCFLATCVRRLCEPLSCYLPRRAFSKMSVIASRKERSSFHCSITAFAAGFPRSSWSARKKRAAENSRPFPRLVFLQVSRNRASISSGTVMPSGSVIYSWGGSRTRYRAPYESGMVIRSTPPLDYYTFTLDFLCPIGYTALSMERSAT